MVQSIPAIGILISVLITGPVTIGIYTYSLKLKKNKKINIECILNGFKYNLGNAILASLIFFLFVIVFGTILSIIFLLLNFLFYLLILNTFFPQSFDAFVNLYEMGALLTPFKAISFSNYFIQSLIFILFLIFSFLFSFVLPWVIVSLPFSVTFFIMAEDTSIDAWEAIQKGWLMINGYKRKFLIYNLILIIPLLPFLILTMFLGLLWYIPFIYMFYTNFYLKLKSIKLDSIDF